MSKLILILVLSLVCSKTGATGHRSNDDKVGFFLVGNRSHTRVPFQFKSNLIIIPVLINDVDTLRFIVDTGVGHTIITDPKALIKRLPTLTRRVELGGAGGGKKLTASVAINNSLCIGKLRVEHHNMVVLDEDVLKLSEYAGTPIHGIIGYELFANLVVTLDFENREITLIHPDTYRYRHRKGDQYAITVQDRKVYTEALSVFDGAQNQALRVVLDTGAGQALLLNRHLGQPPLNAPDKLLRMSLGRGLNGLINGTVGRYQRVSFGKHQLANMLVSFPDSSDFGFKRPNAPQRQGNVGCELLRRFRVTFHYGAGYVVLKPIRRYLRESFEQDMSGLELRAKGEHLHQLIVANVLEDSPAGRAGLLPGDELLFVNKNQAITLGIGEICRLFQGGEGKKINVLARRKGQLFAVHFTLKRLI